MHALVTCKNEDDSNKNDGARVVTNLFLSSRLGASVTTHVVLNDSMLLVLDGKFMNLFNLELSSRCVLFLKSF